MSRKTTASSYAIIQYTNPPKLEPRRSKQNRHWHGEPYALIGELFVKFARQNYKRKPTYGMITRMAEYTGVSHQAMWMAIRGATKPSGTYLHLGGSTNVAPVRPKKKRKSRG
jgi:hypothetical protein